MSWLFSQALVAAYSAAHCSDGEPSSPSSANPTPQAYLHSDRMTAFSRLSRFGMTFALLTESRGTELLTSYLAGFHVKTFRQPEKVQESTANAPDCGWKWRGSLAKYDRDSCSWKTRQCSLLGGLDEFSETWPKWGSMRDGEFLELSMPATLMDGKEYGLWPTPRKSDANTPSMVRTNAARNGDSAHRFQLREAMLSVTNNSDKKYAPPSLYEKLMGWTPEWTGLQPLETDRFRQWQQAHSGFCQE